MVADPLAAERARFRRKLEADRIRTRARQILYGRWNASPAELEAAIAEAYPDEPQDHAAVLDAALEIQVADAPVHLPVESTQVRPLERAETKLEIDPKGAAKWQRFLERQSRTRPVVRRRREA